jgi:hypothetical protein
MGGTERWSQDLHVDETLIDELADRLGEVIVERVIDAIKSEGILPQAPLGCGWLSAHEVARRLGVTREWVYEHANELGAARIGSGPRPRLRFPAEVLSSERRAGTARTDGRRPKRRDKPSSLIPIRAS